MDKSKYETAVKAAGACHYTVDVTVPAEEVSSAFAKVRKEFVKRAKIPGFRPGKAPGSVIDQRFGDQINGEVRKTLLREGIRNAIEANDLKPVTLPRLMPEKDGVVERNQDFVFAVELDVEPEFKPPKYKGLKLTRYKLEVSDDDIEQQIAEMQRRHASYKIADRAAEAGDMLKVSYNSELDSTEEAPEAVRRLLAIEETWLLLNEPEMIPGVTAGLAGVKAGEEKILDVNFADDYYEPFLAAKTARYTFNVLEVHGQALPELTDDFAKTVGAEDLEDLRKQIRENFRGQLERAQNEHLQGQVIQKLLENAEFPLPPRELELETDHVLKELVRQEHQKQPHTDGEECTHAAEFKEQAGVEAANHLRLRYVVMAVAQAEEIKIETEELKTQVNNFRQYAGLSEQQFRERYSESAIGWNVLQSKVLNKLLEWAEISETDPPKAKKESSKSKKRNKT